MPVSLSPGTSGGRERTPLKRLPGRCEVFFREKSRIGPAKAILTKKRRSELCVRLVCCIFEAYMGSAREKESPVRPEGKRMRKPESIEIYKRNKYEIRIQFIHVENTDIFRGFRRHETALHDPRRIARRGRHYGRMVSYIRSLCDESFGSKDQPRLSGRRFLLYSVRFCHWICLRRPLGKR